jgi:hypothetical protein
MTLVRVGLVLAVAVAAAVVANVVLLGVATGSSEKVGNLSPNAVIFSTPQATRPAVPLPPMHEGRDREHDD